MLYNSKLLQTAGLFDGSDESSATTSTLICCRNCMRFLTMIMFIIVIRMVGMANVTKLSVTLMNFMMSRYSGFKAHISVCWWLTISEVNTTYKLSSRDTAVVQATTICVDNKENKGKSLLAWHSQSGENETGHFVVWEKDRNQFAFSRNFKDCAFYHHWMGWSSEYDIFIAGRNARLERKIKSLIALFKKNGCFSIHIWSFLSTRKWKWWQTLIELIYIP